MINDFLIFSSEVTAFSVFELRGTGLAEAYFEAVVRVVGQPVLQELLTAYGALEKTPQALRDDRLRREIFGDEKLGPIARNIIKLWYIGIWEELPHAWTESYGAIENNVAFMVSAAAYTEGLLWTAIGANPPGAKAPGYASWVLPPQIPAF
jgi:hypothetical protein